MGIGVHALHAGEWSALPCSRLPSSLDLPALRIIARACPLCGFPSARGRPAHSRHTLAELKVTS
jgi:hypothetical protein